jgi:hypothetical protein
VTTIPHEQPSASPQRVELKAPGRVGGDPNASSCNPGCEKPMPSDGAALDAHSDTSSTTSTRSSSTLPSRSPFDRSQHVSSRDVVIDDSWRTGAWRANYEGPSQRPTAGRADYSRRRRPVSRRPREVELGATPQTGTPASRSSGTRGSSDRG